MWLVDAGGNESAAAELIVDAAKINPLHGAVNELLMVYVDPNVGANDCLLVSMATEDTWLRLTTPVGSIAAAASNVCNAFPFIDAVVCAVCMQAA